MEAKKQLKITQGVISIEKFLRQLDLCSEMLFDSLVCTLILVHSITISEAAAVSRSPNTHIYETLNSWHYFSRNVFSHSYGLDPRSLGFLPNFLSRRLRGGATVATQTHNVPDFDVRNRVAGDLDTKSRAIRQLQLDCCQRAMDACFQRYCHNL